MIYEQWLKIWLNTYAAPTVKPRTADQYELLIRLHILPHLGERELTELTPKVLQQFVADQSAAGNVRTGKGLAPNTVNGIINVLQSSLKAALSADEISVFTADRICRPVVRERQIECFSLTEQKRIEAAVRDSGKEKYIGILLCLYTGLRIGELIALEWTDINFEKGLLSVTKTCRNVNGVREIGTPKTPSSRRVIPLPRQLVPILRDVKKKSRSPYVVANGGRPISVRSYQRSFELFLRRLGIPHRGFHALRHTFATRALECGMDVKTLSEILGHKSPTITLNRYVHSLLEHKKEMMNRLGKLL